MRTPVLLMTTQLDFGGTERQITETAKLLASSDFDVSVGCLRPGGICAGELRRAGVPVIEFPVRSLRSPAALHQARRITAYLRERGIRIVHTWDYPTNCYVIPVVRLSRRAIAVGSQRSHRALIPRGYRALTRLSDRMAHAVVVNCNFLRRHLIEDEHVPPAKVHVCYNGIDFERFHRVSTAPHPLTIGIVSVLRPEKDVKTLIRGFAAARKTAPDIRLLIVGGGSERAILEQYAREAGVAAAATFRPATDRVAEMLGEIDIFVLPSTSEALSNSLMEAMACGCCPVASNVGGNPELVADGESGMLFPAGDAPALTRVLLQLIDNPQQRQQLARNAETSIRERFSPFASARRIQEIYSSLL